jgi:hypothetical protein
MEQLQQLRHWDNSFLFPPIMITIIYTTIILSFFITASVKLIQDPEKV